jgi:hypothetical protein
MARALTFLNSDTGSCQPEDPRLSQVPLPLGWRKELDEWSERFTSDISKEEIEVYDPRLTAVALGQRRVAERERRIYRLEIDLMHSVRMVIL